MKHKLILDDIDPSYDGMAFLFFQTATPNYAFADDMNHLYRMALARTDDMELDGLQWPVYTYTDQLNRAHYILIERPAASARAAQLWEPKHKLLIIESPDADAIAASMADDFSHPVENPTERNNDILAYYQQALTQVMPFDIGNMPAGVSRKTQKSIAELQDLIANIVDIFDHADIC